MNEVRKDALPEGMDYRDDGCDVHPHCLSCPLPVCRYEESGGIRSIRAKERDTEIVRLRSAGVTVDAIAEQTGVSRRQVFRVLAEASGKGIAVMTMEQRQPVGNPDWVTTAKVRLATLIREIEAVNNKQDEAQRIHAALTVYGETLTPLPWKAAKKATATTGKPCARCGEIAARYTNTDDGPVCLRCMPRRQPQREPVGA